METLSTNINKDKDRGNGPHLNRTGGGSLDEPQAFYPEAAGLPPHLDIIEPISRGGMGIVFKAEHAVTGAKLAVKVLLAQHAQDLNQRLRFIQEARAVCALANPHIVTVHDCGLTATKAPYIVMDYVPGITLDALVKKEPLTIDQALTIIMQIAEAIAHAHKRGIIHRDLKPSNIMIRTGEDGKFDAVVLDFGLAKFTEQDSAAGLTATGDVIGTPMYMSPEQCRGKELDQRSDIYSFGCVIYYMLTGQPPFTADSALLLLTKHATEQAPDITKLRKDIPKGLVTIIKRCLEKYPPDRYSSMDELIADVKRLQEKGTVAMRLPKRILRYILGIIRTAAIVFALNWLVSWLSNVRFSH